MRRTLKIIAWLTIALLTCQLICGLWIRASGADAEGIGFHSTLGIVSVIFGIATSVLAIVSTGKKQNNSINKIVITRKRALG